jgi:hypothetical protein
MRCKIRNQAAWKSMAPMRGVRIHERAPRTKQIEANVGLDMNDLSQQSFIAKREKLLERVAKEVVVVLDEVQLFFICAIDKSF